MSATFVNTFASSENSSGSGWIRDSKGWKYVTDEGTNLTSTWFKDGQSWYHFGDDSYMQTGWQLIKGSWYYFNIGGSMVTGWRLINDQWYLFASGGAMRTGWQKNRNKWYYLNSDGHMASGWMKIDNKWYYFLDSGVMTTGWKKIGGIWYLFNPGGSMVTGWKQLGSTWYYFSSGGAMVTGWMKIKDVWYFFDTSGAMLTTKIRIAICGRSLSETYQTDDDIWDVMEGLGAEITKVDSTVKVSDYDGLLIPGGLDIHPQLYGEEDYACNYTDIDYDIGQLAVIDKFVKAGKPILGVCRGFQLLSVYFGGTLNQDISGHLIDHKVTAKKGSALYSACGTDIEVSSSHHQSIKKLGSGLTATQWAPDGVIEGAEHDTLPIMGVLWHPEWSGDIGKNLLYYYMFTMCTSSTAQ